MSSDEKRTVEVSSVLLLDSWGPEKRYLGDFLGHVTIRNKIKKNIAGAATWEPAQCNFFYRTFSLEEYFHRYNYWCEFYIKVFLYSKQQFNLSISLSFNDHCKCTQFKGAAHHTFLSARKLIREPWTSLSSESETTLTQPVRANLSSSWVFVKRI